MGLFKRCKHKGRNRDRCDDPWQGSFRGIKVSLSKWANQDIHSKEEAQAILDEMRTAIRQGTFNAKGRQVEAPVELLTFRRFADLFDERYVKRVGLKSADTVGYRLTKLKDYFGDRLLTDIKAGDVEDFLASLQVPAKLNPKHKAERQRQPSTVNRWRALLVRMFSWAVEHDYLERTPCNKPGIRKSLITKRRENDPRCRRLSDDEAQRLFDAANPELKLLIIAAIQTGMPRGEMLKVTWADVEARPGWIRLRASTTKTGRERFIPIHPKVQAVIDYKRVDANGEKKPADGRVFSNEVGEPISSFATAWRNARQRAGLADFRWHDLRHEFGSRILDAGGNIIQARDLLGHTDVKTTQRYLNQTPDQLLAAVNRLKDPTAKPAGDQANVSQQAEQQVSQFLHTPTDTATLPVPNPLIS